MENDLELLDMMLADQRNQAELFRPGPYWKAYSSRIEEALRRDGLRDFRANSRLGKGFADTVWMHPFDLASFASWKAKIYRSITRLPLIERYFVDPYTRHNEWHFRRAQKYKDLYYTAAFGDWLSRFSRQYESLPETLLENPRDRASIDGYEIGESYLDSFLRMHNYSRAFDFSKARVVFEIGGGFGAFAHTLLHLYPNIRKYVYLDTPPILYVGTQYLKRLFGAAVMDYRQTRGSGTIEFSADDERQIAAICPWQIEHVAVAVDLFWNSASFQEMTPDMVGNYARHIDRLLTPGRQGFCLYVYEGGTPEKTLLPDELVQLIEDRTSIVFDELEPELETLAARYFSGSKRAADR